MRRRYTDVDPDHGPHSASALLKWGVWDRLLGRRPIAAPGAPAPRVEPDVDLMHRHNAEPLLTWIGHASFFGRLDGSSFLIDPVFSLQVGTVFRRYGNPGLSPEQLPEIDLLLVTHNHYDHLDGPSMRALPPEIPAIVPLGMAPWFRGRNRRPVRELEWWQSVEVGRLRVTLVPARHWSRRGVFDTNRALWGGFVIEGGGKAVYHAGDTGNFGGFREIGRRFPNLLAAMLPIGAYSPTWFMGPNHMNPEQAGEAFLELGARHLLPMHWGAFKLTDEPLSEPAERMAAWWQSESPPDRQLGALTVGATNLLGE